jgi:4-hydroxybenzoate polyprenyltransferase
MNTEIRHQAAWSAFTPVLLLQSMRIRQWSKNVFVFSALLFSLNLVQWADICRTFAGFALFCLISSCVYIVNDYADMEADRRHPSKRHRPLASGRLSPAIALWYAGLLAFAALGGALWLGYPFGLLLALYLAVNLLYSFYLKHIVILDIMTIALGFVLRAVGGALIIQVRITPWFLLCIMLLALFLAIGKRRNELATLQAEGESAQRKVLASYSLPLLDQMNGMVTSAILISYALFTFTSDNSVDLMWTIPFVLYGMFRYLYLIHVRKKGGAPDKLLFEDKHILFTVIGYVGCVIAILYF